MNTELITNTTDLAFAGIREQLESVAEENRNMVFDYATEEGEKAAKKQVRTLRKLDKEISEIHKTIKADALAQCRMIDGVKRDLAGRVAEMVDVHKGPLEAKKAAEEKRVQDIADRIALLVSYDEKFEGVTESSKIAEGIATLEAIEITADGYQERMAEATTLKASIVADLTAQLEAAKKAEAEAAELAELRRQKEEREREEREKRIAEEAAAKAKKEAEEAAENARKEAEAKAAKEKADAAAALKAAEEKAKREAEEAAERERLAIEAKELAEREAEEAKERAEREEQERQAKAKADQEAAEAKRLADEKHVNAILVKAAADIAANMDISTSDAVKIIDLIHAGEISSVSIQF